MKGREKFMGLLQAGDPNGDVATMWQAKEAVRELYAHGDPEIALQWVTEVGRDLQDTDYLNRQIDQVKPAAFGFTSFRNYRIRALLYAGKPDWDLLATIRPR